MAKREAPVRYWGRHADKNDEAFWVKYAMESALSLLWWDLYREAGTGMAPSVLITLDRERGVVTATD